MTCVIVELECLTGLLKNNRIISSSKLSELSRHMYWFRTRLYMHVIYVRVTLACVVRTVYFHSKYITSERIELYMDRICSLKRMNLIWDNEHRFVTVRSMIRKCEMPFLKPELQTHHEDICEETGRSSNQALKVLEEGRICIHFDLQKGWGWGN